MRPEPNVALTKNQFLAYPGREVFLRPACNLTIGLFVHTRIRAEGTERT